MRAICKSLQNIRFLRYIGAQKRTSNFVYFDLITVTYFSSKI
jgi:hypothetical protein